MAEAGARRLDQGEAIFGGFDGLTSVIGVILGLLTKGSAAVIAGAVGLAAASTVGMAAGQYLGDPARSLRRAAIMGGATAVGTLGPVLPFLVLSRGVAVMAAAAIAVAFAIAIAWVRARSEPTRAGRAWAETFVILVLATAVSVAASVVTEI